LSKKGGCHGGQADRSLDYLKDNGLAYNNAYPYISGLTLNAQECRATSLPLNNVITGHEVCPAIRYA